VTINKDSGRSEEEAEIKTNLLLKKFLLTLRRGEKIVEE